MHYQKHKGLTLIEMIVVIVIIGILAIAIIPRIQSAESRARDTARIQNIHEIHKGLFLYKTDNGTYPIYSGGISGLTSLKGKYLSSIPTEQSPSSTNYYGLKVISTGRLGCNQITGDYSYESLLRGQDYILMGDIENNQNGNTNGVACRAKPSNNRGGTHYAIMGEGKSLMTFTQGTGTTGPFAGAFTISNLSKYALKPGHYIATYFSTNSTASSSTPIYQINGLYSNSISRPDSMSILNYKNIAPTYAKVGEKVVAIIVIYRSLSDVSNGNFSDVEAFEYIIP